jgi:hypothetical protein
MAASLNLVGAKVLIDGLNQRESVTLVALTKRQIILLGILLYAERAAEGLPLSAHVIGQGSITSRFSGVLNQELRILLLSKPRRVKQRIKYDRYFRHRAR